METPTPSELIQLYLQDAIAAEKSFESQLNGLAKEGNNPQVQSIFERHARETREQWEALEARLKALGGGTSAIKSGMAHFFASAPKMAQIGHTDEERTAQNLMIAFAVENAECAMYECLAIAAREASDVETANLARRIQAQERMAADLIWDQIAPAARMTADVLAGARAR